MKQELILLDRAIYCLMQLKQYTYNQGLYDATVQGILLESRNHLSNLKKKLTVSDRPTGKLRSIEQTYQLIIQNDPDTSLTCHGLRTLVRNGTIPSVKIGRNIKLNYDTVMDILSHGSTYPSPSHPKIEYGGIRKISR